MFFYAGWQFKETNFASVAWNFDNKTSCQMSSSNWRILSPSSGSQLCLEYTLSRVIYISLSHTHCLSICARAHIHTLSLKINRVVVWFVCLSYTIHPYPFQCSVSLRLIFFQRKKMRCINIRKRIINISTESRLVDLRCIKNFNRGEYQFLPAIIPGKCLLKDIDDIWFLFFFYLIFDYLIVSVIIDNILSTGPFFNY